MKIYIGADKAGIALKNYIISEFGDQHEFVDFGGTAEESTDYVIYAKKVAKAVLGGDGIGILCCGTGIGMSMAANRYKGIRAAVVDNAYCAKYTRLHNDANILCLGGRVTAPEYAKELVSIFLTTEYEGGRHARRVAMIDED